MVNPPTNVKYNSLTGKLLFSGTDSSALNPLTNARSVKRGSQNYSQRKLNNLPNTFNTIGWPNGLTGVSSWQLLQIWDTDRFVITTAPVSRGLGNVAHVTVKPGDKVGGFTGERSEVAIMLDSTGTPIYEDNSNGTTQFFAFSIFVAVGWVSPQVDATSQALWGIPLQLHGPDDYIASPVIALSLTDQFAISLNGGNIDTLGGFHAVTYPFSDSSLNAGAWTDFIIEVGFSVGNSGHVRVSRRNTAASSWTVVANLDNVSTLMSSATPTTGHHYWKQGFYRSTSPNVTNELYITGLVRGTNFNTVVKAAFGS